MNAWTFEFVVGLIVARRFFFEFEVFSKRYLCVQIRNYELVYGQEIVVRNDIQRQSLRLMVISFSKEILASKREMRETNTKVKKLSGRFSERGVSE